MVTKTPLVKPAKPEMPFYSLTPALERGDAAERSKGGFKLPGVSEEQDDESPSEEESEDDDTSEEQELNQWNEVQETHSRAPDSQPVQSTAEVTSKSGFSMGISQERNILNEPAPQKTRISTAVNNLQQARDSPKAAASGTFSAVDKSSDGGIKASESQTIQAESVKPTSGFSLPSIKGEVKYSFSTFFFCLTIISPSLLFSNTLSTYHLHDFFHFVHSPRLDQLFSRKVT